MEIDGNYAGVIFAHPDGTVDPVPPAVYTVELGARDDIGATPATAAALAVNGTASGRFDVQNDIDEYAISLQAGQTYEFDDVSQTQFAMALRSPDHTFLTQWSPFYPALTYTPSQTGTYYLDVSTQVAPGIALYTIGVQLLAPPTITSTTPATAPIAVHRLFDATTGAQFLTTSATEANALLASRPTWVDQGSSLQSAAPTDPAAAPVYRFFDTANGSHLLTASVAERDALLATRPELIAEGAALYEYTAPRQGASEVYRYFDTTDGSHFYTASTAEAATLAITRPDLRPEGIAFYAPS